MRAVQVVFAVGVGLVAAGPAHSQEHRFPTSSEDYPHFYPTAYVDEGGEDWNCGDIYYSGHDGSDFGVGSWAGMAEGRDVVAAADALVIATEDGWFDECDNADCPGGGGFGNHVVLLHGSGEATYYAHLRQGSVAVSEGDTVACGQKIGEVGSSGRSTGPHLHFEVRLGVEAGSPYSGPSADPFEGPCSAPPSRWVSQGPHGALPALQCSGDPGCAPAGALLCGVPVTGNSGGEGATQSQLAYACTDYTYTGPERAYAFTAAVSEVVTVSLDGIAADLDLFVLDSVGCDGDACIAESISPEGEAEALSFEAQAGHTYTVVLDGWEGAISDFSLTIQCTPGEKDDQPWDTPSDDDSAESGTDDDSAGPTGDDDATLTLDGPWFPGATPHLSPQRPVGCSCRSPLHDGAAALWIAPALGWWRRRRALSTGGARSRPSQ